MKDFTKKVEKYNKEIERYVITSPKEQNSFIENKAKMQKDKTAATRLKILRVVEKHSK